MSRTVPILMYHRVGRPPRGARLRGLYTSPRALDRQLAFLVERGFSFCDFTDLERARTGAAPLPERPVLLTFDDGHLDNLTNGLPVLERHGARATVFVLAGEMGRRDVVWNGALERQPTDLLDWEQAARLAAAGVRVEVHGWSHRRMDRMDARELREDLERCRAAVRDRLGHEAIALAYPYGAHDAATLAVAREAGFSFACTTRRGVADLDADPPLALPRLRVRGYRWVHVPQFRLRLGRVHRAD